MERSYKARFYNGKSSQPFTVDVSITDHSMLIVYTDEQGVATQEHWKKEHIRETEFNSSIITLQYGDTFPYQQLEITDPDFHHEYAGRRGASFFKRIRSRHGLLVLIAGLISIIGGLWLAYIYLTPVAVEYAAKHVPKDYEIKMGKELYKSVLEGEKIDSGATVTINHFFSQLQVEGDYPVEITVVKSDIPNAFALPGGGIVVYTKILEGMESPEQLAALLAHEYSHVQLKHATRNIFRSLAGYLFLSVVMGDFSGATSVILEKAEDLRGLSYTRSLEDEADDNGLAILKQNKIDAGGMKMLFKQLKKESNIEMMEMLSTHPDLDNRITNVEDFIKQHPYTAAPTDSLEIYFNQLTEDGNW